MAKFSNINTSEAIERLKFKLGLKSDTELSAYLGISQPLISAWKNRNSIDIDLIITKCNDIDLNWLLRGVVEKNNSDMNLKKELNRLRIENEQLKNKINDMKDVIVDLTLNKALKKRESIVETRHKYSTATVAE